MLSEAPSVPSQPTEMSRAEGSRARGDSRRPRRSLLPTGSPFGWNARGRALYVQFLTALLMVIVTLAFAAFDGWPFLLERPEDEGALEATTLLAVGGLVFWVTLYVATWLRDGNGGRGSSWLLFGTVAAHIVTGTAVCYALGPYTAASGLITVAALLLGMCFFAAATSGLPSSVGCSPSSPFTFTARRACFHFSVSSRRHWLLPISRKSRPSGRPLLP